jgi:hypothetical protein
VLASSVRLFSFLACLVSLVGVGPIQPLHAATRVLILSGLAGDQKESDRLNDERQRLAQDFAARGISPADVQQAGDLPRADILAKLANAAGALHADDTFWLVLLGHSTMRDDGPVFEVHGPRLTAPDLKTALAAIPARQYIVITTEASGGFIPVLAAPNRIVLTATEPSGELNESVFADAFDLALKDPQNRSLLQLARAASLNVHKYYDQNGLVLTEHAMLSDPSQPGPLVEPFDQASGPLLAEQPALQPPASAAPPNLSADENALPPPPPSPPTAAPPASNSAAHQPATPETLAIIQAAKSAPSDRSPAIILSKDVNCLVNADQSQVITTHQQVLIEKAAGAKWGDLEFASMPPLEQITVEKARTIFPDGTYLDAVIDARDSFTSGDYLAQKEQILRLPAVTPGCVIEYTIRDDQSPAQSISGVYQEIAMTQSVPVLACHLTLRLPRDQSIQYRLRNLPGEPTVTQTGYSRVFDWSWKNLPAVDHLEFDPPQREVEGLVMLSSYKTWNDFAAWYLRISSGSDVAGPGVKERAAQVTAGLKTDREKLRALFENVSKVHYAAIELGVGAYRPHTAEWVLEHNYGDCKDKANLLLALARQVGIDGKFVLLNRTSSTDRSFPGFQFNHAIAYFPSIDGGVWCDATDEITAFGQLPPGDVGRDGLLVSASPVFATVPVPPAQATQLREHLVIDPSGKTPGKWTVDAQGIVDYDLRAAVRTLTARQSDAFFRRELVEAVPGATMTDYSLSDLEQLDTPVHFACTFDLMPGLGAAVARLTPLPMGLPEAVMTPDRKLPLVLNDGQPFTLEETLDVADIGAGILYPPPQNFTAPEATASVSYRVEDGFLRRKVIINVTNPTVPPSDYPAFRTLVHQVFAAIVNSPLSPP